MHEVYNRPVVHPTLWDASKSRNGAVHPMITILLYSSLLCEDADAIMLRIKAKEDMNDIIKVELIDTIREATPNCPWDAND